MDERVVYMLGAGFSAPLGLPVSSNFLERAKDLYFGDRVAYDHFGAIFSALRELHVVKGILHADLHNIEEILSILEMQASLGGQVDREKFRRFLADVIRAYSPSEDDLWREDLPSNWQGHLFGGGIKQQYGMFLLSCLGVEITRKAEPGRVVWSAAQVQSADKEVAGFVTLNYDLVLETFLAVLKRRFGMQAENGRPLQLMGDGWSRRLELAKLHGSIDDESIIPPTWNKSLEQTAIQKEWQCAFELLKSSHHWRILGYSLPETDAYVRYLLKAAAHEAEHLKSVDVICLDPHGQVRKRYDALFSLPTYRFVSADVKFYLSGLTSDVERTGGRDKQTARCRGFARHEEVFESLR